jgi:antitoxin component YwqK of YwqJK toxin-antitoxin module
MQNKLPKNEQGKLHGYCERYYNNGNLCFKANYINGKRCGYKISYYINKNLMDKVYYAN